MKAAYLFPRVFLFTIIFIAATLLKAQDFSAGINTETPNPNAVLHLVAPNGDQGLLIPALLTLERTGMIGSLTAADNGLLVYDSEQELFYFYSHPDTWIALTTGSTELDGDVTNELITSGTLVGTDLQIVEGGLTTTIDLSAFTSAPQDLQFAGNLLSLTGDPTPTTVDFSTWDQNAADDLTTADVGTAANQIVQLNASGQLPAVDGSLLTGLTSTVTVDGTTITGDGNATPLAVGTLPAVQISGLAPVATTGSFGDLTLVPVGLNDGDDLGVADGTTILGDGAGTPYAVNVGTAANQIVQLNGLAQLPALDGSLLTGITPTVGAGTITTTEIADGTIVDADVAAGAAIAGSKINPDFGTQNIATTGTIDGRDVGTDGTNQDALQTLTGQAVGATGLGTFTGTTITDNTTITTAFQELETAVEGVPALPATTDAQIIVSNGTTPTAATMSGDVTINNTGVTSIGAGVIVDADVAAGAAIAGSKINPDFGTQNIATTGTINGRDVGTDGTNQDALQTLTGQAAGATGLGTFTGTTITDNTTITTAFQELETAVEGVPALPATTDAQIIVSNGTTPTAATMSGDVTINNTGVTSIGAGVIVDADVAAGAAIAGSKINPDFGAQNIATTGTIDGRDVGTDGTNQDALQTLTGQAAGATGLGTFTGTTITDNTTITTAFQELETAVEGVPALPATTDAQIIVSNGTTPTAATMSGDVTINNTGVTSIGAGVIVDADVAAGAAIAGSKINPDFGAQNIATTGTIDGRDVGTDGTNQDALQTLTGQAAGATGLGTFTGTTITDNTTITTAFQELETAVELGLTIPYSQSVGDAGNLFALTNTGLGGSGFFEINNVLNAAVALTATSNGTGDAGSFVINNATSLGSALSASTNGAGAGISVTQSGTAGSGIDVSVGALNTTGSAVNINHSGTGAGITISTVGPPLVIPGGNLGEVLTSDALGNLTLQPGGLVLPYTQTVTNAGDLFSLTNDGTGGAGTFQIVNAANASAALTANTDGSGLAIRATQTGLSGSAASMDVTDAANPSPGLLINHAGTGPGIQLTTVGPLMNIPGGASGEVLTSDASGNITLQPGGIAFPFSQLQADPDTLFNLTNPGSGPAAGFTATGVAAYFESLAGTTAIQSAGNIEFLDGAPRDFGILPNLTGPGDLLNVYSGDAGGTGGNGGDLILSSGLAAGIGDGGNILLIPGAGAGGGFTGGVFVNGITRFGNPNAGFGGLLELENDDGTFSIGIEGDPAMTADYIITLPAVQGTGALTNDGTGALSWSSVGGFTAPLYEDASNVVFGSATATNVVPATDFQLGAIAPGGQAMLTASSHAVQSLVPLIRANGTQGGETALQAADVIGGIEFIGYDGSSYIRQGQIRGFATENWTGATRGTSLSFFATPNGSTVDNEVLTISGLGLQVNGIARVNNPVPGLGGSIELEDDGGANSLRISANPTSAAYEIIFPAAQGAGALTNDGTGILSWSGGTGAFILDGNANLYSSNSGVAGPVGINNFVAGATGGSLATGNDNVLIGQGAGGGISGGSNNLFVGLNAGGASTVNSNGNVMLGANTINSDDSDNNVAVGDGITVTGGEATSIGALSSATGNNSMALGASASSSGAFSIALGAGVNVAQDFAVAIGGPVNPLNVGIGTVAPASRLDVQTAAGENLDVLNLTNGGTTGSTMVVNVNAGGSPDPAIILAQNSTGTGIDARITNSASTSAIISAQHQGDGNVAFFNQGNNTSLADAMFVQTVGQGSAGVFQISNTASAVPALEVNTDGDNSNAISISKAGLNGVGIAIDMNGQGAQGLFVGGTNPASSSIETDGDVLFRANLITPPLNHDANILPIPSDSRIVKINNAGPDVDQISPGVEGQEIILIGDTGVPPFNIITGGNLRLDNNGNHPMGPGASIHFVYIETLNLWVEISRSR